jgi:hypothetical protein
VSAGDFDAAEALTRAARAMRPHAAPDDRGARRASRSVVDLAAERERLRRSGA